MHACDTMLLDVLFHQSKAQAHFHSRCRLRHLTVVCKESRVLPKPRSSTTAVAAHAFVVRCHVDTFLADTCKGIEMKQAGTCWRSSMAASNRCSLKLVVPSGGNFWGIAHSNGRTSLHSLQLIFTSTLGRIGSIHLRLLGTVDLGRHH